MSRRLRRDLHKRISSAGYQKISGDLEVTGALIGPSMAGVVTAIEKIVSGTTTPVQLTISRCEGAYKAIILQWLVQYNLMNFDHYEIQVSDDDATWYSLEFDGTDWKDAADADTDVALPLLVHIPIPFSGTEANPTGRTLYYRMRQVTILGATSAWSVSASTTSSTIQTGDLAANVVTTNKILAGAVTADKITAATIQTLLLKAAFIWVGFAGGGTYDSPNEGDRRIYVDDDEITFQIYTKGAWSTERQIVFGGVDANSNFRPFLACRGVLGDITDSPLLDPIPSRNHHLFKFDNNAEDQHGVDPWTVTTGAFVYSSGIKWEGTHSLSPSATLLAANYDGGWAVGDSVTGAFMFRDDSTTQIAGDVLIWKSTVGNDRITLFYTSSQEMILSTDQGATETSVTSAALSANTWHFVGVTYDSVANKAYLRVDDVEYSFTPTGSWTQTTGLFYLYVQGSGTYQHRVDDLLLSHDTAMDPDLFFQHVTRNVAWTAIYAALDLLLKPKPGGRVVINDAPDASGGTWHKFADPATGWKASKTAWATSDDFAQGLEVTFSEVPAGAKAVRVLVWQTTVLGDVYYRKSGDTNIANTPHASSEFSHGLMSANDGKVLAEIWLSADYKAQFTVKPNTVDLYIAYPLEYLL